MSPPPSKWQGKCESNTKLCNKKLIGTKNLVVPRLNVVHGKHGTHTASTAAGNFVQSANVLVKLMARLRAWPHTHMLPCTKYVMMIRCSDIDILAGLDAAIHDKCDIVSISMGRPGGFFYPFYLDVIAQGAFRAMQKGITVVCSAGNSGPISSTLSNEAPWIMTVGASSLDRKILATTVLGNGDEFEGESLNQTEDISSTLLPLIYPETCFSFEDVDVMGKIVLCDFEDPIEQGMSVKDAGGAAMILMNLDFMGYSIALYPQVLPAVQVSYQASQKIKAYIDSTSDPKATIVFKGTMIGDKRAPTVAFFSSRGPNVASPGYLETRYYCSWTRHSCSMALSH